MTPNPNGLAQQGNPWQQYEELVASIDGIVWEVDVSTFLFTFVSQKAERLLGYPLEQWFTPGFWVNHLHPDDRVKTYEECLEATREKRPHELEYRMIAADGRAVWLRDIVSVVVEGDIATKLRGVMVDLTEKKQAEAALKQREAELRLALDAARMGEWNWDLVTGSVAWSPACKALYGLPADAEITYERFLSLLHPEDRDRIDAAIKRVVETPSEYYEAEKRVIWPDGTVHWNVSRARLICDSLGRPFRMTGVTMDVTERKRAEEALRESEELFRLLAEKNPDPIMLLDEEGRPVYVSPAFRRLLGKEPTIGLFDDVHPEDLEAAQQVWQEVWTKGEAFATFRLSHADGSWRTFEAWGTLVQYKGRPHALGVSRDLTERKRTAAALWQAESQLRTLIEHYPDFIARFDGECRHLYVSPSVTRAFGIPLEGFVGKTLYELPLAGPVGQNEALEAAIRQAFECGLPNRLEAHWTTAEGERVFEVRHLPERDELGRVVSVLGLTRDVTEQKRAEEALRESEELFRTLAENTTEAITLLDRDGRRVYASPAFQRLLGRTPRALFEGVHPEDLPATRRMWEEVWAKGEAFVTFRTAHADGTWRFFEAWGRLVQYKGKPHVLGAHRDITERKRAEEELRRREYYLAEAQRLSKTGTWAWNIATRQYVYWSQEHFRLHGLDPKKGIPSFEESTRLIHPEDRAECLERIDRAMRDRTVCVLDYRAIHPDGSIKHIHSVGHPYFNESGELTEYIGTEMDITQRLQAEAALRESEQRYREVFNNSSECIWLIDVTPEARFRYLALNPATEQAVGYTNAEVAGRYVEDAIPADLAAVFVPNYRRCLAEGKLISYDEDVNLPTGRKSAHTNLVPVRDELGRIYRLIGIARDITANRQAEAALRESEQRYREVFNSSSECIFLIDVTPECRFQFAAFNPAEEHAVGFSTAEVAGKFIEDAVPSGLAAVVIPQYRRCVEAGSLLSYDEELDLPTGHKSFHTNLIPVRDESGRIYRLIGVARDITEQKAAEAALRRSEEMLRRAQRIGHVGSWVFEARDGAYIGSEECNRICGFAPGPHRLEELAAITHPDDVRRLGMAWRATQTGGSPYEVEHRLVIDGKIRWVYVRGEPEFDAEGRVERITGVTQDITDRKAGEEALRASLREKEVLLREVHHRVKNNLQLISSLLSLQANQLKDGAVAEAFAESQNRVRAMALVHENLYRSEDLSSVRLAKHFDYLCAQLARSYNVDPDRIQLDLHVAEVTLDLDRSLRVGLLVNELVSNAFKHAFPDGRGGRVLVQLDSPRAGWYSLVVSDNGVGLPPKLEPGQSDSLGLQLIADLTEQLGGTLVLDRAGGTTFSILFSTPCPENPGS